MAYPTFVKGDVVSYCGEEAEVVRNFDSTVIVKLPSDSGYEIIKWQKLFEGEAVQLVRHHSR